jgi:hypothetical protein
MNIVHKLMKLYPGSTKETEERITILLAVWTAVVRTHWVQELGHGAVKTQAGHKQREFFIHEKFQS